MSTFHPQNSCYQIVWYLREVKKLCSDPVDFVQAHACVHGSITQIHVTSATS